MIDETDIFADKNQLKVRPRTSVKEMVSNKQQVRAFVTNFKPAPPTRKDFKNDAIISISHAYLPDKLDKLSPDAKHEPIIKRTDTFSFRLKRV